MLVQVVALAVNSGFVAYPKAYTRTYSAPGLTVWKPTAPDGFVAVGCLVTSSEDSSAPDEPPALTDVVCVHSSIGIQAPLGQSLGLDAAVQGQGSTNSRTSAKGLTVWCIDNSMATFAVSSAKEGAPDGVFPLCPRSLSSPMHININSCTSRIHQSILLICFYDRVPCMSLQAAGQ